MLKFSRTYSEEKRLVIEISAGPHDCLSMIFVVEYKLKSLTAVFKTSTIWVVFVTVLWQQVTRPSLQHIIVVRARYLTDSWRSTPYLSLGRCPLRLQSIR